jgi:hypothetical protein
VRHGLRLILDGEPDFVVVAEAGDGGHPHSEAAAHAPEPLGQPHNRSVREIGYASFPHGVCVHVPGYPCSMWFNRRGAVVAKHRSNASPP